MRALLLALLLIAGTFAVYSQVRTYSFINYDDSGYVYQNSYISHGLSWGLSDHFKSGQQLSLQNRPTEVAVQD